MLDRMILFYDRKGQRHEHRWTAGVPQGSAAYSDPRCVVLTANHSSRTTKYLAKVKQAA